MLRVIKITRYRYTIPGQRGNLSKKCINPIRPTDGTRVGSYSCGKCLNYISTVFDCVVCRNRKDMRKIDLSKNGNFETAGAVV